MKKTKIVAFKRSFIGMWQIISGYFQVSKKIWIVFSSGKWTTLYYAILELSNSIYFFVCYKAYYSYFPKDASFSPSVIKNAKLSFHFQTFLLQVSHKTLFLSWYMHTSTWKHEIAADVKLLVTWYWLIFLQTYQHF